MAVKGGFFNSISGDRKYDAEDMNTFLEGVITEGVFQTIDDGLEVVPGTGLQVVIGAGKAWFLVSWLSNNSDVFRTIPTADLTYDRIDIIALDFNKTDGVRHNDILVLEGTPASSPVPPGLIDTTDHLQIPLAHILVEANETVIQSGDITDKRGTVDCPWVTTAVDLIVSVDDITIEIVADDLQVKGLGIDTQHIAADAITQSKIDALAVTTGRIDTDAVTQAKIAPLAVDTSELAADAVTGAKIEDNAVNSEHIAAGAIDNAHIGDDQINSEHYANLSIDRAHLSNDIIDGSKIENDAIDSEHIVADSLDSEHYAPSSVNAAAIAAGAVGNSEIRDGTARSVIGRAGTSSGDVANIQASGADMLLARLGSGSLAFQKLHGDMVGNEAISMPGRKGGSSATWSNPGTGSYGVNKVMLQCGSHLMASIPAGSIATETIWFHTAFPSGNVPIIVGGFRSQGGSYAKSSLATEGGTSNFMLTVYNGESSAMQFEVYWVAIGSND